MVWLMLAWGGGFNYGCKFDCKGSAEAVDLFISSVPVFGLLWVVEGAGEG